jgi:hypothetical protein
MHMHQRNGVVIHTPKTLLSQLHRDNNKTLLSQLHKQHKTLLSSLFSTIIPSLLYVPHNTKRQHNSHLFPLKSSIFISLSLWIDLVSEKRVPTRQGRGDAEDKWDDAGDKLSSFFSLFGSICLQIYYFFIFETFVNLFIKKVCICEIEFYVYVLFSSMNFIPEYHICFVLRFLRSEYIFVFRFVRFVLLRKQIVFFLQNT